MRAVGTRYAAMDFFLRLVPESRLPAETVSVHVEGADWRYESSAVIAGMPRNRWRRAADVFGAAVAVNGIPGDHRA